MAVLSWSNADATEVLCQHYILIFLLSQCSIPSVVPIDKGKTWHFPHVNTVAEESCLGGPRQLLESVSR